MVKITNIRCVLLSSPYADADDPEIKECFPNGPKRTIGMVEVTLDNGVTGLGEGYLAVFAPLVFQSIVDLCRPQVLGRDGFDIDRRVKDLRSLCDYWSLQGAARHVIAAFEIALQDAKAKSLGIPVYTLLGGARASSIQIYGSGGCCDAKSQFLREMDMLNSLGIEIYKIRSVKRDILRTAWVLEEAGRRGIKVGVDMCQNLADPPQAVEDVVAFVTAVHAITDQRMVFVEEALGPDQPDAFRELRGRIDVPVCGGEIVTTPKEMIERINADVYDFVQPDASVMGGISAVMEVFEAAKAKGTGVVVHAWGGAAAIMASYHAAFAAGGTLVEYPMLDFPLGAEMIGDQGRIENGRLIRPTAPGLGLTLTPEMEARYPFDETAVYSCVLTDWGPPPDSYWQD
ncbi:mandelate racemase/muconate lactonizing enzyme family protein [Mesorhizobium sp. B2-3-3]|uniref:mandelate racemase/muconate lactonizing enzyme family protein n=1 Tax=Mesorhizobium sp. B2-3-5 TaxID=2589958 RepID=UPI00112ACFFE|nr:mandelate racemase/muconate lactonizing enzyme family protein [Mesorhizobium sp. B2-3-5]TPM24072.1 mandelate racemase/muconate lactonizing enzyme family protein [Mesorhizobium sp. B2-3-5]TPN09912.1 mandelate racemase/muconate lactonizing enzyme family protein [Mesorhizobium sp. B2-3-3]